MGPLRLVQMQRPGHGLQHVFGRAGKIPTLETGVILDAHSGQRRNLPAPEPGNPPGTAVGGQSCRFRADLCLPGGQKGPDLTAVVRASTLGPAKRAEGVPAGAPQTYLVNQASVSFHAAVACAST